MTTSVTTPARQTTRRRPPAPLVGASILVVLHSMVSSVGLVYFGLISDRNPDVGSPPVVAFAVFGLVVNAVAVGCLPGLLRGGRASWHLLTCICAAGIYFSVHAILAVDEVEAAGLLASYVLVLVGLLVPATRRFIAG